MAKAKPEAKPRVSRAKMLSVRMKRDVSYSEDGVNATQLRKGQTHSLERERALLYVKKGFAELVDKED